MHVRDFTSKEPTAYQFACGAVWRTEFDADNRLSLYAQHGVYLVSGFIGGEHFAEFAGVTMREAKQTFRAYRREAFVAHHSRKG